MDFKFDWSNKMEIGIKKIDEQHQVFFRIGRDVEQLLLHNGVNVEKKQVVNLICELREFTSYHFYFEETIMEKYQYSNIEEHKKEHRLLIERLLKINMRGKEVSIQKTVKELKEFMQDWLFEHLLKQDFIMAREIKNNKQKTG